MSNFTSLENSITEIQSLVQKMNQGKLQIEELETLNDLTRELNERIVILRYKAYEEKVFGVIVKVEVEENPISDKEIQSVISEMSDFLTNDTTQDIEEVEMTDVVIQVEEREEFVETDADVEAPIFGFDLFESNTPSSFAPEVNFEKETFSQAQSDVSVQPEMEKVVAPIVEEVQIEEAVSAPNFISNIEEEVVEVSPELNQEEVVDEFIHSEDITTTSQVDVFRNFQGLDSGSRLMSPKIQSLVGAFGLNEKLQCIRELYNGSSEAFNQAIEKVDNQASFEAAKNVLSEVAIANAWDLDSNLVNEFLQKVERRFL
jgi:DNA-binding Lrp family transcriptional regulator